MQSQLLTSSALALISIVAVAEGTATETLGEVRVDVETLRNTKGHVLCTLFDSDGAYKQLRPAMRLVVEPIRPVTSCVFHDVRPGIYMISAVHDENGNGRLDKNLLGMPKEGYGVSNNHTYVTHGPVFQESTVTIGEGRKTIAIQLRYPGWGSTQ